ncbi:MAG TPA: protein kinase, partial [Thermoanaerobaculia bacterium]|nr:protein kinase [Thermoanaerobaculia bacterium]
MPEGSLLETTYEFLSKVTEGGMGAIYKVRHRHLGEIRIVKVLKPELLGNAEMVQRFAYEAQIVTRLKHPNIAAIYDFVVEDDGMAYIVMEYVDGSNLAQLLNRVGTVELPLALEIASQVLDALSYLHKKKIVHRDVSANNIMLTVGEEGELQVKLIDMGLAKSLETVKAMTSTGVIMGNLFYASPEQLGNNIDGDPLDGRSDLYSLGAVLYEMTTGIRAFNGKTPMDLVSAHAFKAPMSFEESDPDDRVPEALRTAILRALEKSAGKRFATAEAFKDALRPIRASLDAPVDLSVLAEAIRASRPKSSAANPSMAGWGSSTPGRRGSTPGRVRTPLPKPGSGVVFPDTATSDAGEDDSPEARRPIRPGSTDKTRLVDVKSAASLSDVSSPPSRHLLLLVVALGGALAATGGLFLYRSLSEPPRAAPIRRAPGSAAKAALPTAVPEPTAIATAAPVPTAAIPTP